MKSTHLITALAAAAAIIGLANVTRAETIVVDTGVAIRNSTIDRPNRGMSMDAVEARFGQPTSRHAAVGQPPITRWDYPGFSVFFEHQHVIHAVVVKTDLDPAPAPAPN